MPFQKGQIAWNKSNLKQTCQYCKGEFLISPSRKYRKFCSQVCYWETLKGNAPFKGKKHSPQALLKMSKSWFTKEQTAREKNVNWRGEKPKCIDCGKSLSNFDHKRCKQCKGNAQKDNNHWNWKGGISKDKTKWRRERRRFRYATDNNYRLMLLSHNYIRLDKGYITVKTIQQVYEDNIKKYGTLTCYLCLEPIEFRQDCLEHKIPLSRGGTNARENLAIAHRNCNSKKHKKTEEEYRKELKTYGKI